VTQITTKGARNAKKKNRRIALNSFVSFVSFVVKK